MKKYKNIIILTLIIVAILGGSQIIDFAKSIEKSIEEYFTSNKSNYSNLNTQAQKYQNGLKSNQTNNTSSTKSSSSNSGGSIFKPRQKTPEEMDREIMNQNKPSNQSQRDIRFNENRLKKQLDGKKIDDKHFDMDFKELDDF